MAPPWRKDSGRNRLGRASGLALVLFLGFAVGLPIPASADHSGWGVPVVLAKDVSADQSRGVWAPRVAADPLGNAIAVWWQGDATGMSIVSNRYSAGSGWGTARTIETGSGARWFPRIAMDASGNAIAVWTNDPDAAWTNDPGEWHGELPARVWANRYDAAAGWGEAELLGGTGNADEPRIALDPQGNGIALWRESDDGSIWARRYVVGAGWEIPVSIDRGATGPPEIGMDSDGNAVSVWMKGDRTGYHAYATRFAPGTGWGVPSIIDSAVSDSANDLKLAMEPGGNAIAVWTKLREEWPSASVWANRFVPSVGWGSPVLVDLGGFSPEIAMNPAGEAVVAWNRIEVGVPSLWGSHYVQGAWTTPISLGGSLGSSSTIPKIAVDSEGNALVVWAVINPSGAERHISANVYSTEGGWTGETIVFEHPGVGTPEVATLPQGDVLVLLPQWIGTWSTIFANRYGFSSGWGTPVRVDSGASRDAFAPQVVAYGEGNAFAVWSQGDGTRYGIWANQYLEDSGWRIASRVETNPGDAVNPVVGVDAHGNAMVVWEQWFGIRSALWANRYVVGSGWAAQAPIEGADNASDTQVGVDGFGNAIAVWRERGANYSVWASRYALEIGWSEPVEIGTVGGGASAPKIEVNGPGDAVVVWAGDAGIWANRFEVGTGWGSPTLIGPNGPKVYAIDDPEVDVDSAGNAIAVWSAARVWDSGASGVYANRFVPGSGWESATLVASGWGRAPQIGMDSTGNAFLLWVEGECWPACNVSAGRYVVGVGWQPPAGIYGDELVGVGNPQIAVDPDGNAVAVWISRGGANPGLWAKRYVVGTGWDHATYVGGSDGVWMWEPSAQVAADSAGNAYVVWQQWEGDRLAVWANQYTRHSIPPVPEAILQELDFVKFLAFSALAGLLAAAVLLVVLFRMTWKRWPASVVPADELNERSRQEAARVEKNANAAIAPRHLAEKRWPNQNAGTIGVRLIAKERVLLHLLHFARYADAPEVVPELTQERVVEATGINRRHFAQYVRPLVQDGLVRERSAHVRGVLQRRRVYVLSEEGRRKAMEIRDRVRSVVVRMRDASGERDVTIAEALLEARGSMSILDILRESIETGIVDLRH